jgi:hypothetical protein
VKDPPSGMVVASAYGEREKPFVNRNQLIQFLGRAITPDLPEVIPKENGTYVLILHVWKNKDNPIEARLDSTGKKYGFCETQNDSDEKYCKKCGKQLE